MDSSVKIQMDIKNNAQVLQNYMLDLNNWEEEMKKKEIALNNENPQQNVIPPPRNKIKRSKADNEINNSNRPKKISAYDYSAWDKFDVEKACAEVDESDNKEIEEESCTTPNEDNVENKVAENESDKKLELIDEAYYEKEMGNKFVKKEQWKEAIKCYTNAINLDPSNAIYYANRSLCFLKLRNFKSAETDATTAIQLDKNYVKAYQRRAYAREALGQLVEAKSDFEKILTLEPKNALSRVEINKIDEKLKKEQESLTNKKKTFDHKNIFKAEESKQQNIPAKPKINKPAPDKSLSKPEKKINVYKGSEGDVINVTESKKKDVIINKTKVIEKGDGDKKDLVKVVKEQSDVFKPLPEWCKIVHPVNIPPHMRSKKPFRRINIKVVENDEEIDFGGDAKTQCSKTFKETEEKQTAPRVNNEIEIERLSFDIPKTSIQFQKCWKSLKNKPQECYSYLKKIPGRELPSIFENSLESDFFSELVTFLASDEVDIDLEVMYDFLLGLTNVKRFSSLTLFMSSADRDCVKKCITRLENVKSKEEISNLIKLYELKI